MRIGIDIFQIVPNEGRGGGFYTFCTNLIRALLEVDNKNTYVIFANRIIAQDLRLQEYRIKGKYPPLPPYRHLWFFRLIWMHLLLPLYALQESIDVLYFPFDYGSIYSPVPSVVTIHDLIDLYYLKNHPGEGKKFRMMYTLIMKVIAIKGKKTVITVSEETKRDILRNIAPKKDNIRVICEGVNPEWFAIKNQYIGRRCPYIFSILSTSIHKNFSGLIQAYEILRAKMEITEKLVIAGMPGQSHNRILESIRKSPYSSDIELLGYIKEKELKRWMVEAKVFVFVSKKEGFGLPILEAMAAGVPVVTSCVSSMPEISGDAALIVDPDNSQMIAEAIFKVITDTRLSKELIQKGYKRARKFTWQNTARQIVKVFDEIYTDQKS